MMGRLLGEFAGLSAPVVVACSGGPDSVALLALAAEAGLEPIAVHVDHGARPGSAAEADVVAGFAERLGTGFAAETVAVPPGPNFEARAREARYEALERARERLGATAVLVGHSRDDQAETVLLNVLRGAGPARPGRHAGPPGHDRAAAAGGAPGRPGGGMRPPRPGPARRPDERRPRPPSGLAPPGGDPRTGDRVPPATCGRCWPVRQRSPGRIPTCSTSLAGELLSRAADPGPGEAGLDVAVLGGAPEALARRAIRLWLGAPPPAAAHVGEVLAVVRGRAAGGRATRRDGGQPGRGAAPFSAHSLGREPTRCAERSRSSLPGTAAGFGVELTSWVERAAPVRWPDGRWTAVVDADLVGKRAVLRPAAPGRAVRAARAEGPQGRGRRPG